MQQYGGNGLISALLRRNGQVQPLGDGTRLRHGDQVYFFVFDAEVNQVSAFLNQAGWRCLDRIDKDLFTTSICRIELPDA